MALDPFNAHATLPLKGQVAHRDIGTDSPWVSQNTSSAVRVEPSRKNFIRRRTGRRSIASSLGAILRTTQCIARSVRGRRQIQA
ncbi:MAG TPA: hypothetical protein VMI75_05020 [Polyangiaceae bacterium]|nr:hypothetical protein [Polyangiaceae bacterium]